MKRPDLIGIICFFLAIFSVVTQIDVCPVSQYNCRMEFLGKDSQSRCKVTELNRDRAEKCLVTAYRAKGSAGIGFLSESGI